MCSDEKQNRCLDSVHRQCFTSYFCFLLISILSRINGLVHKSIVKNVHPIFPELMSCSVQPPVSYQKIPSLQWNKKKEKKSSKYSQLWLYMNCFWHFLLGKRFKRLIDDQNRCLVVSAEQFFCKCRKGPHFWTAQAGD